MSRPAIAHIRLDALRHNYRVAKHLHGGKALAVIKANAYGHGAVHCAKAIEGEADGFAVACLEEALQLREAGIPEPILLLEGFFEALELPEIVANNLWIVVHAQWQVEILLAAKLAKPLHVWLKMDSGMHRVGLSPIEYSQAFERLNNHKNVAKIVMMTHFANADNVSSNHTLQQIEIFQKVTQGLSTETSLANSAAILGWKQAKCLGDTKNQWTRPGIMLYGADPLMNAETKLKPVMQLTSKIISIRSIKQGESIGYGSIFTAERDTIVGIVACGYADGYPRSAVTGTPMAVDGEMTRLIGRVSMDMLFVDLTDIPNATIGSLVELWGNQVSANVVAKSAGTIAYELFCNVKRAHFQYFDAANI
ncbi:alanine racemase [Methylotenera sp.]|uniref:alanine racemase n=1 Tax=Methylotenera sp. TaxID=2051956 RepID=UPI00248A5F74|nr:alanine racemase [Methylotenera sp.]MDI1299376.1 alanine racemase [Methylotenera sp.]